MKKVITGLVALLFAGALFVQAAQAAEKIAYVDLSKIFAEYTKTQEYDKVLTAKEESYTKDRDAKVDDIKKFQDRLSLLSEAEQEKKRPELETKIRTLREYDSTKQRELRKEQDTRMKEILKDIEDTVAKYAEQNGYTLVLNDRVLVYQTRSLDITDAIIGLLNKG